MIDMKHTIQEENIIEKFIWEVIAGTEPSNEQMVIVRRIRNLLPTLLASQLQSILEEVEEMKKNKRADFGRETSWEIENKNGYYEAINDVQSIISNRMGTK